MDYSDFLRETVEELQYLHEADEDDGSGDGPTPPAPDDDTPTPTPDDDNDDGSGDGPSLDSDDGDMAMPTPDGDDGGDDGSGDGPSLDDDGGDDAMPTPDGDDGGSGDDGSGDGPSLGDDDGDMEMPTPDGGDDGGEGGDDSGEDGGEGSDDNGDGDSEGEDGEEGSEEDNTFDNIKKIEKELFSNLSDEQMAIKNSELKSQFIELYATIGSILVRINDVSKSEDNIDILKFVTDKLLELRKMIDFNITTAYNTRTYIENNIIYQQCISTLNAISDIIDDIPNVNSEEKDNDEDEDKEDLGEPVYPEDDDKEVKSLDVSDGSMTDYQEESYDYNYDEYDSSDVYNSLF